jgi:hypothetical protein
MSSFIRLASVLFYKFNSLFHSGRVLNIILAAIYINNIALCFILIDMVIKKAILIQEMRNFPCLFI